MEKLQKIVSLIGGIMCIIIYISLGIEIYSYQNSFLLLETSSFKYPDVVLPSLITLAVLVLFVIFNISKNLATSKLDYFAIRRNSLIRFIIDSILILVLIIVTKNMLNSIFAESLSLNKHEVDFFVGYYYVIKNHFLTITIISLIDSMLTFLDAKNNIAMLSYDNMTSPYNKK